ncbi:uncharacterized protein BYT42DRAFT_358671 [Radiomyces spectabilis]|uniref:uncharacterized protein n=1 Tax=Radiomyces spectabilis TaxID=64574 RepID=UPI00221F878E|nr:uncharacterized protein BYT42DRAFT_358671 [Radiomyces spectabilis]KAI8377821.1 hypothetical protein BYT42DRAFT_358671 [Radiomyces spectabilis]
MKWSLDHECSPSFTPLFLFFWVRKKDPPLLFFLFPPLLVISFLVRFFFPFVLGKSEIFHCRLFFSLFICHVVKNCVRLFLLATSFQTQCTESRDNLSIDKWCESDPKLSNPSICSEKKRERNPFTHRGRKARTTTSYFFQSLFLHLSSHQNMIRLPTSSIQTHSIHDDVYLEAFRNRSLSYSTFLYIFLPET